MFECWMLDAGCELASKKARARSVVVQMQDLFKKILFFAVLFHT